MTAKEAYEITMENTPSLDGVWYLINISAKEGKDYVHVGHLSFRECEILTSKGYKITTLFKGPHGLKVGSMFENPINVILYKISWRQQRWPEATHKS